MNSAASTMTLTLTLGAKTTTMVHRLGADTVTLTDAEGTTNAPLKAARFIADKLVAAGWKASSKTTWG